MLLPGTEIGFVDRTLIHSQMVITAKPRHRERVEALMLFASSAGGLYFPPEPAASAPSPVVTSADR